MAQEDALITELRAEFDRARRFNLSTHAVLKAAQVPVGRTTLYRWMSGQGNPTLKRLRVAVGAVRSFLNAEQTRLARGAKTNGGPLTLDDQFFAATRDGVVVRLKQQEFRLLELLRGAKRPAYFDWICEVGNIPQASLKRAASELRRKLLAVDFEVVTIWGRGGERSAYVLSDKAAGQKGEAA